VKEKRAAKKAKKQASTAAASKLAE
jgi:hypothetical protein